MGIDRDVAAFLLAARERKANFHKTLMLGNQKFQFYEADYKFIKNKFAGEDLREIKETADFFRHLGAAEIAAMDVSDYEGAAVIHDLNQPIPDALEEKYSFVLDGGTLEHVFNFPVGLANAMRLVETGGHLCIITGGNNFLGHGFYQFSPELFYRTLNEQNGFQLERLIAAEVGGRWFEAADPQTVRGRVELINDKPTYLMVLAKKIANVALFAETPQQSDYAALWESDKMAANDQTGSGGLRQKLKQSEAIRLAFESSQKRKSIERDRREKSFNNSKAFRQVEK